MKFTIYQIKEIENINSKFLFKPWRIVNRIFSFDNYNNIYENDLNNWDVAETDDINMLEIIYSIFNGRHPEDYTGRSISVSDIVELNNKFYFCDSFGWKDITNFIK